MDLITPRVGVIAFGRNTFDVALAENILEEAWDELSGLDLEIVGEKKLLFDSQELEQALSNLKGEPLDLLLMQPTPSPWQDVPTHTYMDLGRIRAYYLK